MIHRKGATKAYKDQYGIIPGSQGTSSYIVIGKGNIESFMSCSHGAGRLMSRTAAKNTLDLDTELAKMEGVLHSVRGKSNLDEAPGSYKNINVVMQNQVDLVSTYVELTPLACIKG
jgi:tRNA-splicing ligase RtcB